MHSFCIFTYLGTNQFQSHMNTIELKLILASESDVIPEEIVTAMQQLRTELLETEVKKIEFQSTELPEGAKGLPIDWGTLLVTLTSTQGLLGSLITLITNWLQFRKDKKLILEYQGNKLELSGVSGKNQQKAIDEWVQLVSKKNE
jgi:hypothetical protein